MSSSRYPATGGSGSSYWKDPVANFASLPASGTTGEVRITLDSGEAYAWTGASWSQIGAGAAGSVDLTADVTGVLPRANGGTNSSTALNNNRVMISSAGKIDEAAAITGSRALASDSNGLPVHSATTATELGYVSGVTSALQTQLDGKLDLSGDTMTGDLTLAQDPSSALHAATKQYVDAVAQGLDVKPSVKAASTGPLTRLGEQTVDDVVLTSGMRILVKDQVDELQNGIYSVAVGAWTRVADMNHWDEVPSAFCFVEEGTTNGATAWVCISPEGGTIGTDDVIFVQFAGAGTYTADGQGLELTGSQFSLELDGSTLSKSGSGLKVATSGISDNEISASAAITRSKLAAGTANRLVYNDGSGVMSDLSAITASRVLASDANGLPVALSAITASRALVSDVSGYPTHSAVTATELGYVSGVTSGIQSQLDGKEPTITTLGVNKGGTGQTTANAALNALLPAQTGNSGKYLKTDGADTSWAAASGGSGEINAITNPSAADSATTGTTAGTGHTRAQVSGANSPLNPVTATAFDIECSAQQTESSTSGVYWSITMPSALKSKKLKVEFYVTVPSSDVWRLSVYDGTTRLVLSTDSSGVTTLPAGFTGKFTAYFDTTTNGSYSVNITCTNRSGANHLYLTNLIVGPGVQPQGAVRSKAELYTPSVSGLTIGTSALYWERDGEDLILQGRLAISGSSASEGRVGLPSGLTVGHQKGSGIAIICGKWWRNNSTATNVKLGSVICQSDHTYVRFGFEEASLSSSPYTAQNGNNFVSSPENLGIIARVPIAEWAGSGTANLAQNDVEYAYNTDTSTSDNTSAFGYGPSGVAFGSFTSNTTGNTSKRVRFTTPILATDIIRVEIGVSDGTNIDWFDPAHRGMARALANSTRYGIGIDPVSTTDVDVLFGKGGINTDGVASYAGNNGNPWSNVTSLKWRVRKQSASSAAGFGHGNSSAFGLVKAYSDPSTGKMGIGTDSPDTMLHVHKGSAGTIDSYTHAIATFESSDATANYLNILCVNNAVGGILVGSPGTSNRDGHIAYGTSNRSWKFFTANTLAMTINSSQQVKIGTTSSDDTALQVNRNNAGLIFNCESSSSSRFNVHTNGKITATITNWTSSGAQDVGFSVTTGNGTFEKFTSSRRYKENIKPAEFDSANIYKLNMKQWKWKDKDANDFGFIAEEVAEFFPEAVNYAIEGYEEKEKQGKDKDGKDLPDKKVFKSRPILDEKGKPVPEAVKYRQLVAPMIEEMKKLKARIEKLEGGK